MNVVARERKENGLPVTTSEEGETQRSRKVTMMVMTMIMSMANQHIPTSQKPAVVGFWQKYEMIMMAYILMINPEIPEEGAVIWITIAKPIWAGQSEVNTMPMVITIAIPLPMSRTNSILKWPWVCVSVCVSLFVFMYVSVFVSVFVCDCVCVWAGRSAY